MTFETEGEVKRILREALDGKRVKTLNGGKALQGKWHVTDESKDKSEPGWDLEVNRTKDPKKTGRSLLLIEVKCTTHRNRDSCFGTALAALLRRTPTYNQNKTKKEVSKPKIHYCLAFNKGQKKESNDGEYFDEFLQARIKHSELSKAVWKCFAEYGAKYVFIIDDKKEKVTCYDWKKFPTDKLT